MISTLGGSFLLLFLFGICLKFWVLIREKDASSCGSGQPIPHTQKLRKVKGLKLQMGKNIKK